MTFKELLTDKELKEWAEEEDTVRFQDGLLLCEHEDCPASATLSKAVGWFGCAPCITGEADSFDVEDLVLEN